MRRILSVFGTRPEAIKMIPIVKALEQDPCFDSKVCVTGQHREMLDQVLEVFGIRPDFDLDVMEHGQSLSSLTNKILLLLGPVFEKFAPDMVLVHGDTTTTLATSLSAYYHQIPIGHVEAGLRSANLYSPWPEEGNRRLTGVIADAHFAPTERAAQNLKLENVDPSKIFITGNTVVDSLMLALGKIKNDPDLACRILKDCDFVDPSSDVVLITGHRRENFGKGFEQLCQALIVLAERFPKTQFVFPVHLNPMVSGPVRSMLAHLPNMVLTDPKEYLSFVWLMNRSKLIITDSGGIQEEAPSLGKPVLVTRENTERPEAVLSGNVKLVGTDSIKIAETATRLLRDADEYNKMSTADNPYGDGNAAKKICDLLKNLT